MATYQGLPGALVDPRRGTVVGTRILALQYDVIIDRRPGRLLPEEYLFAQKRLLLPVPQSFIKPSDLALWLYSPGDAERVWGAGERGRTGHQLARVRSRCP